MTPEIKTEEIPQDATILLVESERDPDYKGEQRQINFSLTVNGQTFVVPDVWVRVCREDGEILFDKDAREAIRGKIFEIQHPKQAQWAKFFFGED